MYYFQGPKIVERGPSMDEQKKIARDARMRDDSYTNYKNTLKTLKLEENICGNNSRLNCSSRLNGEVRRKLFIEFYLLHPCACNPGTPKYFFH